VSDQVIIAEIGKPHGLKGEAAVWTVTDEPETRYQIGSTYKTDTGRKVTIAGAEKRQGIWYLRFEGVDSRSEVEALRGKNLWGESLPVEEENVYNDVELIGLEARDEAGERLGEVVRVLHLPAQDLLEIKCADGNHLVPFVAALVPSVDVQGGYVQIAQLEGLL
jgi:16S rRNA processing protein RimM